MMEAFKSPIRGILSKERMVYYHNFKGLHLCQPTDLRVHIFPALQRRSARSLRNNSSSVKLQSSSFFHSLFPLCISFLEGGVKLLLMYLRTRCETPTDNSCNYSKNEALTRTRLINHSSGSIIPVEHAIKPNQPYIAP